jgi:competence protein ComEC
MIFINLTITKSRAFFYVCLFFIFGIAAASFYDGFSQIEPFCYFAIFLLLLLPALILSGQYVRLALALIAFFIVGIWRVQISLPDDKYGIAAHNNEMLEFTALINSEPDVRLTAVKYRVAALSVAPANTNTSGRVLVSADPFPLYAYGDMVRIKCRLEAPEEFSGFAYDRYLAMDGIYSVCYRPQIGLIDTGRGNRVYALILGSKNKFRDSINLGLTEPQAGFARALMFGDRRAMPADLEDDFARTGLTHIVAISGMNITILSALSLNFLISLGLYRRQAYYFSVLLLIVFIIMIGLPASAVRAAIMGILVLTAQQFGRLSRAGNAMALAACLMLLLKPGLLRNDVGFQLSFLSVTGLVTLYPRLRSWYDNKKLPALAGMGDALLVTMAAIIFTLPVIAYNFSRVSLVAPLANILVVWGMAPIMILAIMAIAVSLVAPVLAVLAFFPCYLLLEYIIRTAGILSRWPPASLETGHVHYFWIFVYYLLLALILNKKRAGPDV